MTEVVMFCRKIPYNISLAQSQELPLLFAGEMDGKQWFCANNKKVYKDLQQNPNIEVSVSSPAYAWIHPNGKAVFENNMAKRRCVSRNPSSRDEAANPIFEVFYLKDAHAVTADFSGNPPKEYDQEAELPKCLRGQSGTSDRQ